MLHRETMLKVDLFVLGDSTFVDWTLPTCGVGLPHSASVICSSERSKSPGRAESVF